MLWQVTVASIGPRLEVDQEGKATGRERVFLHSLTGLRSRRGNWSINTLSGCANWPVPRPVHHFLAENLHFSGLFSSNT